MWNKINKHETSSKSISGSTSVGRRPGRFASAANALRIHQIKTQAAKRTTTKRKSGKIAEKSIRILRLFIPFEPNPLAPFTRCLSTARRPIFVRPANRGLLSRATEDEDESDTSCPILADMMGTRWKRGTNINRNKCSRAPAPSFLSIYSLSPEMHVWSTDLVGNLLLIVIEWERAGRA